MEYRITANRKRPQTLDELIGQEFVVETLKHSIGSERIAQAYLFSGPRGVGKTSAARVLARALNCSGGPTVSPCMDYNDIDLIEIDGASNTSVNDVRAIREEVLFAPQGSRYKIYIIDEVHMLSNSAFNALLKTIEEPPPYVIFIFATTEIHKVPATIRSRCQQFAFRLIPLEAIMGCLRAVCNEIGQEIEREALFWIAKEARGSLRDAYTILDQVCSFGDGPIDFATITTTLGVSGIDGLNRLVAALHAKESGRALQIAADLLDSGISVEQLAIDLCEYYRALLFLRHGIHKEAHLGYSPERFPQEIIAAYNDEQLEAALNWLLELYRRLRYSLNQRFELELILGRLALLEDYISPASLLRQLREMKSALGAIGVALTESSQDAPGANKPVSTSAHSADVAQAASIPDGSNTAIVSQLAKRIASSKPMVATALEQSSGYQLLDKRLVLEFEREFELQKVSDDLELVQRAAVDMFGYVVELKLRSSAHSDSPSPKSEAIRRAFQGEIVEHD